jgi:4-hydroxybenzoyl-CoA thioesterase
MLDVTEQVVNRTPLRVRRRVKWGECDPAGVVYTARFSDYLISAFELFMRQLLESAFQSAKDEHGFGTPCKALSLEFFASLRPDEEFEMTVLVTDIRNRTFDLEIQGRGLDGKPLFSGRMTPITIKRGDRSRAIELPAMLRERLEAYRISCTEKSK